MMSSMPAIQGFVADCTAHFHRMQVKQSWADTDFRNGAEAMAAILEVMRRHEVRQAVERIASLTVLAVKVTKEKAGVKVGAGWWLHPDTGMSTSAS